MELREIVKESSSPPHNFKISRDGIILDYEKNLSLLYFFDGTRSWIYRTFLPVGFPHSVRKEYFEYQVFDSLQALCSYFRSVLCTKALLKGAGVGSAEASALAAAVTWVLRDGIGMLGSVTFASIYGDKFGAYVKEWRLFADIINDIALTLDMLSPLFPSQFYLLIISCSSICKAMCGISAGASKLCITNHLALSNNAGDLAAKENTQETAVTLCGLVLGLIIAQIMSDDVTTSWILFISFTLLHVYTNYRAVLCLKFSTLNPPRSWFLIRRFLETKFTSETNMKPGTDCHIGMSIEDINAKESLVASVMVAFFGPWLGKRFDKVWTELPVTTSIHSSDGTYVSTKVKIWDDLSPFLAKEGYVILPQQQGVSQPSSLAVVLSEDANAMVELRAFFHCILLLSTPTPKTTYEQQDTKNHSELQYLPWLGLIRRRVEFLEIVTSYSRIEPLWIEFLQTIKKQGWDTSGDTVQMQPQRWRYNLQSKKGV